ncbi:MAG: hypothetical protein QXT53_02280 [Ignisphaera sp.]
MYSELYEKIKKIFDAILNNEKISSKDIYAIFETINKLTLDMKIWCNENQYAELKDLCIEFDKNVSMILSTASLLAVTNAVGGDLQIDTDIFGSFLKKLKETLDSFNNILQNTLLLSDGAVLCKILKPCQIRFSLALPGYIIPLPIGEAVLLSILGFVKVIDLF